MNQKKVNKTIIYEELQKHKSILEQFGVMRIGLYGSYVRDEAMEESDIDFLVEFEKEKKTLKNLVNLGDYLESVFGKKIDIVTPQGLSPYIGPYILKEVQYATFAS